MALVRLWEHHGRDEFRSFQDHTLEDTSDAQGTGTAALVRAALWYNPCAQHGYIVFLRKHDGGAGEDDEDASKSEWDSSDGDEDPGTGRAAGARSSTGGR